MTPDATPNHRILVVDDNLAIHDDFRKILCDQDPLAAAEARLFGKPEAVSFHVDVAQQGEEGLGLVQRARADGRPYAMAFVDVRMPPGWDGVTTTRRMCEVDPDLQIVICTAHSDYSWKEINDLIGPPPERFLILKKPFDPIEVVQLAYAITDKWRLLQESKSTLRQVVGSLPGVFYIIDEQGRFLRWNDNFEKVTGYSADEISRMSVPDFLTGPEASLVAERIQQVLSTGERMANVVLVAKDRTRTPYLVSGKRGSLNGAPCIIGVGIDISALTSAEAELRLQSAALNAAANAIAITDSDGTIVWTNRAFTTLTGYSDREAIGRNFRMLKSGIHEQPFYQLLWDTIQGGRVWRGEITNRRKDGSLYPEEMVITPVHDAGGGTTHFIAIKRDLTEEKALEAQFLQAQKMEVVGRLAGGIAHDFNNLLTVINGVAELAAAAAPAGDPVRDDLEEIHAAGLRAAALTRQLLAFSRRQVMNPEVVNLTTLVAGMRSMLESVLGADIHLAGPGAAVGLVKVDPGQIEQVIMNLAVNARDAMPGGGTLTIDVQDVAPGGSRGARSASATTEESVLLTVDDTGTGMDERTRSRIFEPYFTTKGPGKGSGLGLATVDGIVKQSGGSISVDTEPGRGTTFRIYLPRVGDSAQADGSAGPATPGGGTETILVVEDEDGVRRMTRRMLERCGYTVLTASSGAEALLLLEGDAGDVRLMLTDVIMPLMSGPELVDRVAGIRPQMKVLFTSGHVDNEVLRQKVLREAANFIGKPYTKLDLARRIREILDDVDPAAAGIVPVRSSAKTPRPPPAPAS